MADYADSPFQMDEDLVPDDKTDTENAPSIVNIDLGQPSSSRTLLCNALISDSEDFQTKGLDYLSVGANSQILMDTGVHNVRILRTRIGHLKIEEKAETNTEEEEMTCEEDVDDKFDRDAAARNHAKFKYSQTCTNRQPLTPPENFAPVVNKIYRSSFPQAQNFPFLKKLGLRSVLCLIPEEYPESHAEFFEQEGIKLFQLGMAGNKEPFVKISADLITDAMKVLLSPENHPILIHCNRGKHRTGCLVGVLRRLQGWSLTIIFDEYRKFAAPKERSMDQQFIELYDQSDIKRYAEEHKYLPLPWD